MRRTAAAVPRAAPPPPRQPAEQPPAGARRASVPSFTSSRSGRGLSLLPIVAGVILTFAITAYALTRGKAASAPATATRSADLQVITVGRPPVPESPPVAEPEPPAPVVTRDLPPDEVPAPTPAPAPRAQRKATAREAVVRPARAAPPREVARADRPATPAKAAPATLATLASAPIPSPAPAARPEPEVPAPPPQFVAAPPAAPPTASAPMAIGPSASADGYQKARQARPGCVTSSLRLPRDLSGLDGESAVVKFQVDETGAVSQFTYLSGPTDQRVGNAIWAAVQRCEWAPGVSAQGTPLTLWVTMPIKFGR